MLDNSTNKFDSSVFKGLNDDQVKERQEQGLTNAIVSVPTKSFSKILAENLFTLFNALNFILALSIIIVGASLSNTLFMGVVFFNTIIGSLQEIRAKRAVDKLSLLSARKPTVIRNSKKKEIDLENIVLDDLIVLKSGEQVPTDCILLEGICEVNESLLTGESNSMPKREGDRLFSGSFLVSGNCKAKAFKVGNETYVSKIAKSAKYVKKTKSQILNAFKKIMTVISFLILPLGALFFIKQMKIPNNNVTDAVLNTVAVLIGMIPEGLVLLTSTVLAISVIRLSRSKVLVQNLYCIETLARVDVLCLDKTGTITEGKMEVNSIKTISHFNENYLKETLNNLVFNLEEKNATFLAIADKFSFKNAKSASKIVPFSSERKWSGIYIENEGAFIIGAPEFVLKKDFKNFENEIKEYSKKYRVLVVTKSQNNFTNDFSLPNDIEVLGFVFLKDKIRKYAKKTLSFFKEQGVQIKIISGDNIDSVLSTARLVGMEKANKCIDMRTIKTKEEIEKAALECNIFGRVSPIQKKQLILALKKNGKTVAMTGDGVNDVLALKESDCSIAMASGSEASRNVSELVLLNSNFNAMPKIVADGRRAINNIQRSSSLFLVKTIYSVLLAICFLFLNIPFPFQPIQMTLSTAFTIGIPSFFLSLESNKERVKGSFLLNIISKAMPGAVTVVLSLFILNLVAFYFNFDKYHVSTMCVLVTTFIGFMILFKVCIPFNLIRKILFSFLIFGFCFLSFFQKFKKHFSISSLEIFEIFILIIAIFISFLLFMGMLDLFNIIVKRKKNGFNE